MAEEVAATPGWVEGRLDSIWKANYLPTTEAVANCRNEYLTCLSTCTVGTDPQRCQDHCRAELLTALKHARVAPDTIAALEADLEALEAEISDRT